MNLGQRFWRENEVPRLLPLLTAYENDKRNRSFEWHYLLSLCHKDLAALSEKAPVSAVACSPTENLVAFASGTEVGLWDPESANRRSIKTGHSRDINAIAFSGDSKLLATASSDRSVRLWNVATGEAVLQLPQHDAAVLCVAFHPMENLMACGSREGKVPAVILWNTRTGQKERTLHKHHEPILSVAFSADGTRLLSGGGDVRKADAGEFWLWDARSGESIASYSGHGNAVTAVAFHPDGKTFASAGDDRAIRVWQVAKPTEAQVLRGHRDRVTSLAFDKSGTLLASGSLDRNVILWNLAKGDRLLSRQGHVDGVRSVAFNLDGTRVFSVSSDGAVKMWSADGDQEFAALRGGLRGDERGHTNTATGAAFSPDGLPRRRVSIKHHHLTPTGEKYSTCSPPSHPFNASRFHSMPTRRTKTGTRSAAAMTGRCDCTISPRTKRSIR